MAVTGIYQLETISLALVTKALHLHLISMLVIYRTSQIQVSRRVVTSHRMFLPLFISHRFNNKKSIHLSDRNFISLRKMQVEELKRVAPHVTFNRSSPLWRVGDSCQLEVPFCKRTLTFKAFRAEVELVAAQLISTSPICRLIKARTLNSSRSGRSPRPSSKASHRSNPITPMKMIRMLPIEQTPRVHNNKPALRNQE